MNSEAAVAAALCPPRRFAVGQRVIVSAEEGIWLRAHIVCLNYALTDGKNERLFAQRIGPFAPYQVYVSTTKPLRGMVQSGLRFVPTDTDAFIRIDDASSEKKRFDVGEYIECRLLRDGEWTRGRVVMINYPLPYPHTSGFAAYQILTFGEKGGLFYIIHDDADAIRAPLDVPKKKKKKTRTPPQNEDSPTPDADKERHEELMRLQKMQRDKERQHEELVRLEKMQKYEELANKKQQAEALARDQRRALANEQKCLNAQRKAEDIRVRDMMHEKNAAFEQSKHVRIKKLTPTDQSLSEDAVAQKTESLQAQAEHNRILRENEALRVADAEKRMEFIRLSVEIGGGR